MNRTDAERLCTHLRDAVGEHLRVVAFGAADDHEFLYVSDEVVDAYSDRDEMDIRRDVMFENIDSGRLESLYSLGAYRCTVRLFESGLIVTFTEPDTRNGVLVSLDATADPQIVSFVEECHEQLQS